MSALDDVPRKIRSIWPPLLIGLGSLGMVIWAQRYGAVPRLMPTVVGVALVILCLLDLASRFDTRLGRWLRVGLGADFRNREMSHDPALRDELVQALWMVGCIVLFLVIGILPAVPVFIAGYMRVVGKRPWLQCLISAAAVLAFVTVVFEVLLDYALYRGLIFDPKGFGRW